MSRETTLSDLGITRDEVIHLPAVQRMSAKGLRSDIRRSLGRPERAARADVLIMWPPQCPPDAHSAPL